MKNKHIEQEAVITAFAIFIGVAIFFSYHVVYEVGYKKACKDFYQGKVKYDLVTNSDGTSSWKKVE